MRAPARPALRRLRLTKHARPFFVREPRTGREADWLWHTDFRRLPAERERERYLRQILANKDIIFFIFVALGALSYFIFNKCFFTSIELKLSEEKNLIQNIVEEYFGEEIEGNIISKIVLSLLSIIAGIILLKDYGYLKLDNIRK